MSDLVGHEEAIQYIIRRLRERNRKRVSEYGYSLYLRPVMEEFVRAERGIAHPNTDDAVKKCAPVFYAAAWDLCRRGILRPGVETYGAQVTDDGQGGSGYSITPQGRTWIDNSPTETYVPYSLSAFDKVLDQFTSLFGIGFRQRAMEAAACYHSQTFLSCCAMCGAAAESLFLAVAIAKMHDEDMVLRKYRGAHGRKEVLKIILQGAKNHIDRDFRGYSDIISYWRDEASHGIESDLSGDDAYIALLSLLRFAHYAKDNWNRLTK